MQFSDDFLVESRTARDEGLVRLRGQQAEEQVLNKVKSLFFAVWNGVGRVSGLQLADYYEVSKDAIDKNYERCKEEFIADGVEVLRGKALRDARDILSLASKTSQEIVYTPAGVLRMGFILRDSSVAKMVRTTAIRFIQGVGQKMSNELILQKLIQSNPILTTFTEGQKFKISAPYSRYWEYMKSTLSKKYPNGGIPNTSKKDASLSKDEIRKSIQFLSTYTDLFKLQGIKELRYELASQVRGKYPDLTSDVFYFETDTGTASSVILFQFDNLIIDVNYVEECLGRGYIQVAREFLQVDNAYLVFVAPFGATSYAEDHIRRRLVSDHQGSVGVLTVRELANFLYTQAVATRKLGTAKGEINSEFKELLYYNFPEIPQLSEQLDLDLGL